MPFTITRKWLHDNATGNCGWTAKQLALLGVVWPPKKGWLSNQTGRVISDDLKFQFEQGRRLMPAKLTWNELTPQEQASYDREAPCWSRDTTLAKSTLPNKVQPPSK